jgi:hypothetical protein
MLCDGPKDDAKCIESTSNPTATPFAIAANDAKDFWIKPPDGRLVGKYTGSFWISADQSKSGTALAVTFYESSTCRYIIGLAILVGSVIVAWFIGVWLRADVNKLQLERPFALLRSQQQAIAHEYEKLNAAISGSAETFARQLAALRENLKTANLKDVLGTGWPSAFGAAPQISDDYKSRLESLSNKTALLKKLMEEGLLVVNRMPTRPNATSVAEEIAGLSVGDAVTGDTAQKLADALARLHEPLGDALEAHFLARTAIQFREPTVQMIDLSLQSLSIVAWLVLAVVSVAMGWYLLILNHPGFGTYTDFFFCAAWGLGLPAGATGLASATTTTIATAFKIGT